MALTFLSMTNDLLVTFNETPLNEGDFDSARGVHARAKNCIQNTVNKIHQEIYDSPLIGSEISVNLVQGKNEYKFPDDILRPDWNSFQIKDKEDFNTLKYIETDEWYNKYWSIDSEAGEKGREKPLFVFPSFNYGFGITPSPDKNYFLTYRYTKNVSQLINATDTVVFPDNFNNVVQAGGAYFMYQFKSDVENTQIARQEFQYVLKRMRAILTNHFDSVRDTRIRRNH